MHAFTNFLQVFINFSYLLFLSPTRFTCDKQGVFHMNKWWLQKIICLIFAILDIIWTLNHIYVSIPTSSNSSDPSKYFQCCLSVLSAAYKFVCLRFFWFRQPILLSILNYISQQGALLTSNVSMATRNHFISRKLTVSIICFFYFALLFCNIFSEGRAHSSDESFWSLHRFCKSIAANSPFPLPLLLPHGDKFLTVFTSIGYLHLRILSAYCDLLLLMVVMTMWTCSRAFALYLQQTTTEAYLQGSQTIFTTKLRIRPKLHSLNETWLKIQANLEFLRKMSASMNKLFGQNVTLFLSESVLYYSIGFNDVFVEAAAEHNGRDWGVMIRFLVFFGSTCAIMITAADVTYQMDSLKEWLSVEENRMQVELHHLQVLLNQVDTHLVSVKGSNIFPITYGVIANVSKLAVQVLC